MPFGRAAITILVSTLLISGSAFMGWLYYLHLKEKRFHDEQYNIVAIVQNVRQPEALKTVFLAELLGLSINKPCNLYRFNLKEAEKKLLLCPLIKKGTIKKIVPGTIYIDYEMRAPYVFLGDFSNTVLDEKGFLFPFTPFFTPKHLPIIYLGLDGKECNWGKCLKDHPKIESAFEILKLFKEMDQGEFFLKQLDLSQMRSDSYGQRQIVMILKNREEIERQQNFNKGKLFYLRLNTDRYSQDLINFFTLYRKLLRDSKDPTGEKLVIDLRIPHLAFIEKIKKEV